MRFLSAGLLAFCLAPGFAFGASREIIELQRDIAALQDQVRNLDHSQSESMARLTTLLQQALDGLTKMNTTVAVLDAQMRDRDKNIAAPVTSVGAKMDQMSSGFQAMQASLDDVSARLGKLEQNLVDLQNTIKVMQAPPSMPSAPTGMPGPGSPGAGSAMMPPAGTSAESLYANALRDKQGGSEDMALSEFNDYLRYYGTTDSAPNAQYYIGEIFYHRKDYDDALKAFDMVLERYPENNKTLDAMYMKGLALVQMGERSKGAEEFRAVYKKNPQAELARKAKQQLANMGLSVNAATGRRTASRNR
jgi:TolA-binding protein